MQKKVILLIFLLILPVIVHAANCTNRDPITSTCTCNGASVSSGYCCYYDPALGNITYQPGQTCGYTKWSPHYQSALISRPINVYLYGSTTPAQWMWLAQTSDMFLPVEPQSVNLTTMKSYNPNLIINVYELLQTNIYGQSGTPLYDEQASRLTRAQAWATANNCTYEDFFMHFSSQTSYSHGGQAFNIPAYNATNPSASRVQAYVWGVYRYVWNLKNTCLRNFLADEFYNVTHSVLLQNGGTYSYDGVMFDEVALYFPIADNLCESDGTQLNSGGALREYANQNYDDTAGMGLEYDKDVRATLDVIKAKSPDKYFFSNIAECSYNLHDQIIETGNGADGVLQEFYINLGAERPLSFEYAYNLSSTGNHIFLDGLTTRYDAATTIGSYATKYERSKMSQIAWYYLSKDAESKLIGFSIYGQRTYSGMETEVDYPAFKYDVGLPTGVVPSGKTRDSGAAGTAGVYILQQGIDGTGTAYWVYAKDYTHALVLQNRRGGSYTSTSNPGDATAVNIPLNGTYYLLREQGNVDTTPLTSITLRYSEGAVLVKSLSSCNSNCSFSTDVDCNNKVDNTELSTAIQKWYSDQFTISQLLINIKQWKAGFC